MTFDSENPISFSAAVTPDPSAKLPRFAISQAKMIARGAGGHLSRAFERYIPLDALDGLEPVPSNNDSDDGQYHPGRPILEPIEVQFDGESGRFMLYAGNHRIAQAHANSQTHILAFVEPDRNFGIDYIGPLPVRENPDARIAARQTSTDLAQRVAWRFQQHLQREISDPKAYALLCLENLTEPDPGIFHSHLYPNVNQRMAEAARHVTGEDMDQNNSSHAALWVKAWGLVKATMAQEARTKLLDVAAAIQAKGPTKQYMQLAVLERYKQLIFPLQDAWPFVHGSKDEGLKKECRDIMHGCSEFADVPLVISEALNIRIHAALEKAWPLVDRLFTSDSAKRYVARGLVQGTSAVELWERAVREVGEATYGAAFASSAGAVGAVTKAANEVRALHVAMSQDWRTRRIAFVNDWSDALIAHVVAHVNGSADDVLAIVELAAEDICISRLREGGDAALMEHGCRALGFKSSEQFNRFNQEHSTLYRSLNATVAESGFLGRVIGISSTVIALSDAQGHSAAIDRTKLDRAVALGDIVSVGDFGKATKIATGDSVWFGNQEKAVRVRSDGAKEAIRFGNEVTEAAAVLARLARREKGDDLPIVMEGFGCNYDAACDAVFGGDFESATVMLNQALNSGFSAADHLVAVAVEWQRKVDLLSKHETVVKDVTSVMFVNALAILIPNDKSIDEIVFDVFERLNIDRIQRAALTGGDTYESKHELNAEIVNQLCALGVMAPIDQQRVTHTIIMSTPIAKPKKNRDRSPTL